MRSQESVIISHIQTALSFKATRWSQPHDCCPPHQSLLSSTFVKGILLIGKNLSLWHDINSDRWLTILYTVHLYTCTHVHDINSDRCLTVLEEVVWSTCRVMVVVLPLQLKVISSPGWADISHLSTTLVLSATVYSNWVRLLHVGGSEVWKINGAIHFSPNLKLKLRNPKIAF